MLALLLFPGTCKKKTPKLPPQSTAPTTPQQQPQGQTPTPNEQKPAEEPPKTETKPEDKTKSNKPRPHTTKKAPPPELRKPTPPATATVPPPKPPAPAPTEPNLSASIPTSEIARRRQQTVQLLAATDIELKSVTRTLSADEQNMMLQIRGYIQQSHSADTDGDPERAYNFALKAKLLADELSKR
jgi:hypothetical protein